MNYRRIGYLRDRYICEVTEERRALETEQYRVLVFGNMKSGLRKAQERLKILTDKGKLKCYKGCKPYIYHVDNYKQLQHIVGVNWIRLWFERCQPTWRYFKSWDDEQTYLGILRTDGFCHTYNAFTKEHEFWFIEFDRGTNNFNKADLYQQLYISNAYAEQWWVKLAKRFPLVLVVTTSKSRASRIREIIDNTDTEVRFKVKLLSNIKKEVLKTCVH